MKIGDLVHQTNPYNYLVTEYGIVVGVSPDGIWIEIMWDSTIDLEHMDRVGLYLTESFSGQL